MTRMRTRLFAQVCGSMNAGVAQWLVRTGIVAGSYRVA